MIKLVGTLLSVWMCVAAAPAAAATFDGSNTLICAFMDTVECTKEGCSQGDADDVSIADFVRLDFKKKLVTLLDEERRGETTEINRIEKLDDRVLLQGIEGARGWSLSLFHDTGDLIFTVSGDGSGFVVFGECTKP